MALERATTSMRALLLATCRRRVTPSSAWMYSSGTICVTSPRGGGMGKSFPTRTGPVAGFFSSGITCATGPVCTMTRPSLSRIASRTAPTSGTGIGWGGWEGLGSLEGDPLRGHVGQHDVHAERHGERADHVGEVRVDVVDGHRRRRLLL